MKSLIQSPGPEDYTYDSPLAHLRELNITGLDISEEQRAFLEKKLPEGCKVIYEANDWRNNKSVILEWLRDPAGIKGLSTHIPPSVFEGTAKGQVTG